MNANYHVILWRLDLDELTGRVELVRGADVRALVDKDKLVHVAVLAATKHAHVELLDAGARIPDLHQLKRLAFVYTFEEW